MLDVSPKQCVVIEDSKSGVSAAVNAGCITIAAPNSFTKYQDLSHATLQIESFSNITLEQFFQLCNCH